MISGHRGDDGDLEMNDQHNGRFCECKTGRFLFLPSPLQSLVQVAVLVFVGLDVLSERYHPFLRIQRCQS